MTSLRRGGIYLLDKKPDGSKPAGAPRTVSQHGPEVEPERLFRCAYCGEPIAREKDLFAFRSSSSVQVFPNPYGRMMKIVTFRRVRSLVDVGEPTTDFTWFDGYAWTIEVCARCRGHLGWRYDGVDPSASPPSFFGLLADALRLEE